MEHDKENALTCKDPDYVNSSGILIKYCRVCEFVCPVARKEEKKNNQVSI
jgi:hypothetical protein